ncbi:MAG: 16S rRNA (cytosine(967)-C(5))-methyltransferase RsmB [Oscillospiraceae bacterium]
MKTSRQSAYDTLLSVCKDKAYSNIALDKTLTEAKLESKDKSFATVLFYGVLERKITLDYILSKYSKKPVNKLDKEVLVILEMGIYQLLYMDSVPDSAAVDECVKLVAYARKASAKPFVNAVLRGFIRDKKEFELPNIKSDKLFHYSVKYSCPKWLFSQWEKQYDLDTAIKLSKASLERAPLTVRVNTLKTTTEKLIVYLANRGVKATEHSYLENCLLLEETGSIEKLPQYRQGLFYVQDAASQLCVKALNPIPNQIVLDICSAPGSKSFTIAQYMQNEGELYSFDLYEHKLKLIKDSAKRLGITIIQTALQDGAIKNDSIKMADRVLCDVPCSGLGIIRRKPEIKYKNEEDFKGLPEIQYNILKNAASYVKSGGCLVYSTCTTNKKENEEVVNRFLSENNSFKPLQLAKNISKIENNNNSMITLLPHINECDGFFIALFEKSGEILG